MPADENARRDKALESIARELVETNRLLAEIARNTKRVTITNHVQPERPDPFSVPQLSQPDVMGGLVDERPTDRPVSDHPYFRRSYADGRVGEAGSDNQRTDPLIDGTNAVD